MIIQGVDRAGRQRNFVNAVSGEQFVALVVGTGGIASGTTSLAALSAETTLATLAVTAGQKVYAAITGIIRNSAGGTITVRVKSGGTTLLTATFPVFTTDRSLLSDFFGNNMLMFTPGSTDLTVTVQTDATATCLVTVGLFISN